MGGLMFAGLLAQAGAGLILGLDPQVPHLQPILWLHGLACGVFSLGAMQSLKGRLNTSPKDYWFFLLLCLFIPVFGMLGLCLILPKLGLVRVGEAPLPAWLTADTTNLPETPRHNGQASVPVSSGMLINILQNAPNPNQRMSSLLSTLSLPDQEAIAILRVALRDSEDDVRLLAYALLSQLDKRYNDAIQTRLESLRRYPDSHRGHLHKQLAHDYWELAWVGLARGDSEIAILEKASEFASLALERLPEDAGLRFLLGRILLRLNRLDHAEAAFARALVCGLEPTRLAPYFAELSFKRRHLNLVSDYMQESRANTTADPATSIKRYWGNEAHENWRLH